MYKKINLFNLLLFLFPLIANAQIDKLNTTDLHPVSPTAFQFLKYTEMPVSEYTGIPNISIPLCEINVDEVKIPVQLTYHSQGIRINQEASWVGLGWDLNIGSIIQSINDRDDYGDAGGGSSNIKLLPDYINTNGDGSPTALPIYNLDPNTGHRGNGWSNPYPIQQPQPLPGFAIATNAYLPVNGQFYLQQTGLFTLRNYDSEPDIFVANFLGYDLKFILDFNSQNNIVVLNRKGFVVTKTTNGFSILDPKGTAYYFEIKSTIQNTTSSISIDGAGGSYNEDVSNIFFLSKIITTHGKLITFEYASTSKYLNYPNFSQKMEVTSNGSPYTTHAPPGDGAYIFTNFDARNITTYAPDNTFSTTSTNSEQYFYISSIIFENGRVDFEVSDRTDQTGSKKLDFIRQKDIQGNLIKSWQLDYSYFDASSVNSNGFGNADFSAQPASSLRLRLLDIKEINGGTYLFQYNPTALPKKNSFAQDYWGFYNGKTENTSLVPNPSSLNLSSLGNNGNNKDADLTYTKACILEGIQYPTGGRVLFDYESNEFDKQQMYTLPTTGNTIKGFGLRISSISHYQNNNSATFSMKSLYSYEGGELINAIDLVRQIPWTTI